MKKIVCPYCGKPYDDGRETCPFCGELKPRRRQLRLGKAGAVVLCVLVLAGSLFFLNRELLIDEKIPVEPETEPQTTSVSVPEDTLETRLPPDSALEQAIEAARSIVEEQEVISRMDLLFYLQTDGFSEETANEAIENCGADWQLQAGMVAEAYLDSSAFSRQGLIGQLEYEGFTLPEAEEAVANCGADWMEQAVLCARSYLELGPMDQEELVDLLLWEAFTGEEAAFGAAEALRAE